MMTKAQQQELVADFVYEKHLELSMYIYLDAFVDVHRKEFQEGNIYSANNVRALLEASHEKIRNGLKQQNLLTKEAAGKYLMTLKK